jgi:acyl-[acyl-carrier-protein]-phospholipid O-acyltransferase/long-chain-fatty-acid--[acyl-carrier-protein] ligase
MDPMNPPTPASPARFGAYLYTQFCSAFNDNVHCFAIALYLTQLPGQSAKDAATWQSIAGAAFGLPFILFSPLAGTLADRFNKRSVLIWAKWLEVVPMSVSLISTMLPAPIQYYGLIAGIFLMEVRSAFFSPSKYGILAEVVSPARLTRANGILQMLTMVGIVSGEAIAGSLYQRLGIQATIATCLAISVVGSLAAFWIPQGAKGNSLQQIKLNPFGQIWGTIRHMRTDRVLVITVFTLSCFWLVSAVFKSNMPVFGIKALNLEPEKTSQLMAIVSIGIGIGAAAAGMIGRADDSMRVVLPGVLGMALASSAVYLWGHSFATASLCLGVLGFFGGLYLVPQTTIFQARSPADQRGAYLAVQNLVNYAFMLIANGLYWLVTNPLECSPPQVFLIVGIGLAVLGVVQTALLPDLMLGRSKTIPAKEQA